MACNAITASSPQLRLFAIECVTRGLRTSPGGRSRSMPTQRKCAMENRNLAALSWLTLAVGVILIVAPLTLGFPAGIATTNSLISGLLVAIASLAALRFHNRWEAWPNLVLFNLVLGAWVFISPLLFHFNTNDAATWIYDLAGVALMVLATVQMWRIAGELGRVRPVN
jgi:hypothetical protein